MNSEDGLIKRIDFAIACITLLDRELKISESSYSELIKQLKEELKESRVEIVEMEKRDLNYAELSLGIAKYLYYHHRGNTRNAEHRCYTTHVDKRQAFFSVEPETYHDETRLSFCLTLGDRPALEILKRQPTDR